MPRFKIRSPKLKGASSVGRSHWYPYYAGYSPDFVVDILAQLDVAEGSDSVVADPWNGSGTTTTICSLNNVVSAGFDINPAMVVVAKARLLDANVAASLSPLLRSILSDGVDSSGVRAGDPLLAWFTKETAGRIRSIELAARRLLVDNSSRDKATSPLDVGQLSSLAAFFYVLLFRLVRRTTRRHSSSNPTWTRSALDEGSLVRLTARELLQELEQDLKHIQLLDASQLPFRTARAEIFCADSRKLPLKSAVADAVITSPPYCTRIDYAVATRMELAVLGMGGGQEIVDLRRQMLGTTLTQPAQESESVEMSPYVQSLLVGIGKHKSKASSTYYLSTYRDYFVKLTQSLQEVARIVKPDGKAVLVVQDSAYKDIHVDLARATSETMGQLGFEQTNRWDFECERSMRDIGELRRRAVKPVESVLMFRRS